MKRKAFWLFLQRAIKEMGSPLQLKTLGVYSLSAMDPNKHPELIND